MGRDLRGDRGGYQNGQGNEIPPNPYGQDDVSDASRQEIAGKLNRYQSMDSDSLMNELITSVTRGKNEGRLTNADLDSFVDRMRGMLSPEQSQRLYTIVDMLKK